MSSGNGWTAKGSSCSRTRPPVSIGFGAGFSASSFFKAIGEGSSHNEYSRYLRICGEPRRHCRIVHLRHRG
ncbi:hypothetical protein KCU98_g87, partial [Aureobasidium melanogenum]